MKTWNNGMRTLSLKHGLKLRYCSISTSKDTGRSIKPTFEKKSNICSFQWPVSLLLFMLSLFQTSFKDKVHIPFFHVFYIFVIKWLYHSKIALRMQLWFGANLSSCLCESSSLSLSLALKSQFCGKKWGKRPDVLCFFYRQDRLGLTLAVFAKKCSPLSPNMLENARRCYRKCWQQEE